MNTRYLLLTTYFFLVGCDNQTAATHKNAGPRDAVAEGKSEDHYIKLGMIYEHAEALLLDHGAENISSFIGYRVATSIDGVPTYVANEYFETKDGIVYRLILDTQPVNPIVTGIERADSLAKLADKAETWINMDSIKLETDAIKTENPTGSGVSQCRVGR